MNFQKYFPGAFWIYRIATGKTARRVYLAMAVLLLIAATAPRIRSMLMARKIHAVLAGMDKIRIDETTEGQLLKTVPFLTRNPNRRKSGAGIENFYSVEITNENDWERLIFNSFLPAPARPIVAEMLDWLGYRYMGFRALIVVLDGKVSSVRYGVSPRLGFPRAVVEMISVQSVHAFWAEHAHPIEIDSLHDESPQFGVTVWKHVEGGPSSSVHVTYTADAPNELTSDVFRINLRCFWGFRGCTTPEEMAPQFLRNKAVIEAKAISRLRGSEPCPASMLRARVRYLLDADVILLEATSTKKEEANEEGERRDEFVSDYKLKEVIRGGAKHYSWKGILRAYLIPAPWAPLERILNPVPPPQRPGDPVLFFGGEFFDSCRFVPVTASTLTSVRNATLAPKRPEDAVVMGLQ
ncbi:MAG TPA: hypothetical protein VHQ22_16315 [Terriglobales bacterium]|jgi:hypothetical protein|nr:hypothetical protein [Terriglobales bacterium]